MTVLWIVELPDMSVPLYADAGRREQVMLSSVPYSIYLLALAHKHLTDPMGSMGWMLVTTCSSINAFMGRCGPGLAIARFK